MEKVHERYRRAIRYLDGLANLPLAGEYMIDRTHPEDYLKRMEYFLGLIGNPERGFEYVHITGTSGKGSVSNMVSEIIAASGKKVGLFTSPFATASIEKIKVGRLYIAPDEFANIVEYLKPYVDESYTHGPYGRPSYFELFLAIAFVYFKKMQCEMVVLEVGLGGRYDATNVISNPRITAITNIDYDHTEILGNTLELIAQDKAGIIKRGSHFFTTESRPEIRAIFEKTCKDVGAQYISLTSPDGYVGENRVLAEAITKQLGIADEYIKVGIERARLPARFEIMQSNPTVIIDGAHNGAKMRSTALSLTKLSYKKLFLVLGISGSKESQTIVREIVPQADMVFATRFQMPGRPCTHPKILAELGRVYLKEGAKLEVTLDPWWAFESALREAGPEDIVLVTGSFFLAGEIRERYYSEEWILQYRTSFR